MNTKHYYTLSLLTALGLSLCFSLASFLDLSVQTVSATELAPGGFSAAVSASTSQLSKEISIENQFELAFARANETFVSQVISKYNKTARSDSNPNCGPASMVMIARWLNLPYFEESDTQVALDKARLAVTGNDTETGIYMYEFQQYASKSDIPARSLSNIEEIKVALDGKVAVLALGNPFGEKLIGENEISKSYAYRIAPEQYGACSSPLLPKGCPHFIVVLAYNQTTGSFIVNDPLRKEGPLVVSEAELAAFFDLENLEALTLAIG